MERKGGEVGSCEGCGWRCSALVLPPFACYSSSIPRIVSLVTDPGSRGASLVQRMRFCPLLGTLDGHVLLVSDKSWG